MDGGQRRPDVTGQPPADSPESDKGRPVTSHFIVYFLDYLGRKALQHLEQVEWDGAALR